MWSRIRGPDATAVMPPGVAMTEVFILLAVPMECMNGAAKILGMKGTIAIRGCSRSRDIASTLSKSLLLDALKILCIPP